jgi:hypothetical protein
MIDDEVGSWKLGDKIVEQISFLCFTFVIFEDI